jgi:glycosyltransferase involved in cell wall biosynthesis
VTVSIVIATYNSADVLGRALDSIAAQTYHDYEVIVVDDGSTDDTAALVRSFETVFGTPRLTFIRTNRNEGGAAARNRGVRAARGTHVAFLDADDEWLPAKLEQQVAAFEAAPSEVGLITTQYRLLDSRGALVSENIVQTFEGPLPAALLKSVEGRYEIIGVFSTVMMRRNVFDDVGGLDEGLRCWHDTDFYLRAAERFAFAFVATPLTVKHERRGSVSYTWRTQDEGSRRFWQKHRSRFGSGNVFRRFIARHQHALGVQACLAGEMAEGRRLFLQSLTIWPLQWRPIAHLALAHVSANAYAAVYSRRQRFQRA